MTSERRRGQPPVALGAALALLGAAAATFAPTDPGDFVLLAYTGQIVGIEESCLGDSDASPPTEDYECAASFSCTNPPCDCPGNCAYTAPVTHVPQYTTCDPSTIYALQVPRPVPAHLTLTPRPRRHFPPLTPAARIASPRALLAARMRGSVSPPLAAPKRRNRSRRRRRCRCRCLQGTLVDGSDPALGADTHFYEPAIDCARTIRVTEGLRIALMIEAMSLGGIGAEGDRMDIYDGCVRVVLSAAAIAVGGLLWQVVLVVLRPRLLRTCSCSCSCSSCQ
jgi:hypothetical protein